MQMHDLLPCKKAHVIIMAEHEIIAIRLNGRTIEHGSPRYIRSRYRWYYSNMKNAKFPNPPFAIFRFGTRGKLMQAHMLDTERSAIASPELKAISKSEIF